MKKGALFFSLMILLSFDVYASHLDIFPDQALWGKWFELCAQNTYPFQLGSPNVDYCANANDYGCFDERIRYYCTNYQSGGQSVCSQQVYTKNVFVCPEQSCPADTCDGFTFVDYQPSCRQSCGVTDTQSPDPSLNTACNSCSCASNRQAVVGMCGVQCLSHINCAGGSFCENYQCVPAGDRPHCSDGTFDCYKGSVIATGCGDVSGCINSPIGGSTCNVKYNSIYEGSFLLNPADALLCDYDFIECGNRPSSYSKNKLYIQDFTEYTCPSGSFICSYGGEAFYQERYAATCTTCQDSDIDNTHKDGWNLNAFGTCTDSTSSYADTFIKEYYCNKNLGKCSAAACPDGKKWDAATNVCVDFFCNSNAECGSNLYCVNTGGSDSCKTASEICSNGVKDTVSFTTPILESDVDCGGSMCNPIGRKCANDKICFSHGDCQSGACVSGRCSGDSPPISSDTTPSGNVMPLSNSLTGYAYFDAENNVCAISGFVCDSRDYDKRVDINLYKTSGHWLNNDFNYVYFGSATANLEKPEISTLVATNCGGTINHAFSLSLTNPPTLSLGVFGVGDDNNLLIGHDTTDSYNVQVIDYYCTNSFTSDPQVSQTYTFPIKKGYVPISVSTNEFAFCRYHTTDTTFGNMRNSFQQFENGFVHKATFKDYGSGINTIYVRCKDINGLETPQSAIIQFNIDFLGAKCTNSVKDFDETDIDCGNNCVPLGKTCARGKSCNTKADCSEGFCSNGICRSCIPPSGSSRVSCPQRIQTEHTLNGASEILADGRKRISIDISTSPADETYQRYFAYVKGHVHLADNTWQEFSYTFDPSIPTVDFFDNSMANSVWYDITGDGRIAASAQLSLNPNELFSASGVNNVVAFICNCPSGADCRIQSLWQCNGNTQNERGIHKGKWTLNSIG
ncbi:MAG TPA: hypothetical protein VJH88_02410 [Candidatus Nanoarchaeia archaeon]|nr:hypothetical protein [Candidatus Nanoarchaeia archaeon]